MFNALIDRIAWHPEHDDVVYIVHGELCHATLHCESVCTRHGVSEIVEMQYHGVHIIHPAFFPVTVFPCHDRSLPFAVVVCFKR